MRRTEVSVPRHRPRLTSSVAHVPQVDPRSGARCCARTCPLRRRRASGRGPFRPLRNGLDLTDGACQHAQHRRRTSYASNNARRRLPLAAGLGATMIRALMLVVRQRRHHRGWTAPRSVWRRVWCTASRVVHDHLRFKGIPQTSARGGRSISVACRSAPGGKTVRLAAEMTRGPHSDGPTVPGGGPVVTRPAPRVWAHFAGHRAVRRWSRAHSRPRTA